MGFAFRLTFLNKCDEYERPAVAEFYQRCFGEELPRIGGPRELTPMGEAEGAVDLFKRVLTATARAIADEPEASVAFGAESPAIQGTSLNLPLPARELPATDVGRGARRRRFICAQAAPPRPARARGARAGGRAGARAVYDAAEQARVEALGARAA